MFKIVGHLDRLNLVSLYTVQTNGPWGLWRLHFLLTSFNTASIEVISQQCWKSVPVTALALRKSLTSSGHKGKACLASRISHLQ
jgi:hypothetical protein